MNKLKKSLGNVYMALVFIFLYAPIVTLIVYSFNAGKGRKWTGFSFDWYRELFESDMIMSAVGNTLSIALLSALAATVIGVVSCLGINAMRGKKRDLYMALNNVPLLNSDLVTGLSLMLVFILFGITFGYGSVLLAHISFNIPYVILSVLPRLRQMNYSIYEAAVDLGAKPMQAFWKVVIPDLFPAVISGFLMAFTMSLDDFIVTHFTKGPGINTISTLIYSEVRVGINPAMNALSAIMFLSAIVLLVLTNVRGAKEE